MSDLDRRLQHALAGSATVKRFEQLRLSAVAAVGHSRFVTIARRVWNDFRAMPRGERTGAIGIALVAAAIVHTLMNLASGNAAGSYWLIVPATALAVGVLGLMFGKAEQQGQ